MAPARRSRGAAVNLADVMRNADPRDEPCRDQTAILDGTTAIVMLAVLDRTVVVELNGERQLIPQHRFDVEQLRWQKRTDLQPRAAWRQPRKAKSASP